MININQKMLLFALFLMLGLVAYGQNDCSYKQMTAKIDSIAKARNIEEAKIQFHRVTSNGESATTNTYQLTRKKKFTFDGQFLVIGDSYFNIEKLLFFFVRKDHIEFYFQAY